MPWSTVAREPRLSRRRGCAMLTNADWRAPDAQGMQVGEYLFLGSSLRDDSGFTADGVLRLVSVRIDGFVCCQGARLTGEDREAD